MEILKQPPRGILYICSTPIGNLEDITLRALRILKEVDLIVAEDTLHTLKLLSHYKIKTRLTSYYKYDKVPKTNELIMLLKEGKKIALVSNAGTPAIQDPGFDLIKKATEEGIQIDVLPGANSILPALVLSAIDTSRFLFVGFLPQRKKKREDLLKMIKDLPFSLIFFLPVHDLLDDISEIERILGNRKCALVKEITKIHQKVIRGRLSDIFKTLTENKELIKGEFTLVVEGGGVYPRDPP